MDPKLEKYRSAQCAYNAYRRARANRMDTFWDLSNEEKDQWLAVYKDCVAWWKSRQMLPLEKLQDEGPGGEVMSASYK